MRHPVVKWVVQSLIIDNALPLGIIMVISYLDRPHSFRLRDVFIMGLSWFAARGLFWLARRQARLSREQNGQTV